MLKLVNTIVLYLIGIIILLFICSNNAAPSLAAYRNRNLIPFPRVGRSKDLLESADYHKLDAFIAEMRNRRTVNRAKNITTTGLWFGPRLGRIQKKKDNWDDPVDYLLLRDLSSYKHAPKYTPRLGRDSEEFFEDLLNENMQTSY